MESIKNSRRRVLLYVTIDPYDHRDANRRLCGHGPNLARVHEAAAEWQTDTVVRDVWCGNVTPRTFDDSTLLALFLSGSYTEWVEVFRRPAWGEMLDGFCNSIRATSVPILAACGGHQLVAYAFGGWKAVGHMSAQGAAPVSISEEADGVFCGPNPRVGEVGTFLYHRAVADPLFADLADAPDSPLIFSQWHFDQVFEAALPVGAVSLVRPTNLKRASFKAEGTEPGSASVHADGRTTAFARRQVASLEECCRTQALRYDVSPVGRVLYTTQFHPDLAGADAAGNTDHGIALIHNFQDLADRYWLR